jgi:UDPglucose--hexose-1-phosphate uridylyltransferase
MMRAHLITGEPILFAPERASRPGAFAGDHDAAERCPFCPGHEEDTPPQIAAIGEPWRVRVFPNKYPSVPSAEVIVESPHHDDTFDRIEHAEDVVRVYIERYRAHASAAYTCIFKNEGPLGGASIPHVHSQVMPLPFVPPRVEREANAFARAARCPLCTAIESHRRDGLVIRESSSFVWLTPVASWMVYQQWIVPKRHVPEMTAFDENERAELAMLLRAATRSMLKLSRSFNWSFQNFPREACPEPSRRAAAHFYVDLFPRLTSIAGFELATGTFIEIIDPASASRRLAVT